MDFCRLCAQQKQHLMPVKELDIKNKVKMHLQIIIGDSDILPRAICLECLTKLNQFREFHSMSIQSQLILAIIFKTNTNTNNNSMPIPEEMEKNEPPVIDPSDQVKTIASTSASPKLPTKPKLLSYSVRKEPINSIKPMEVEIEEIEIEEVEINQIEDEELKEFIVEEVSELEEDAEMIEIKEHLIDDYEESDEDTESDEKYVLPKRKIKKKPVVTVVTVSSEESPAKTSKQPLNITKDDCSKVYGLSKPRRDEFKKLICYVCDNKFGSNLILAQHIKSEHKNKPIQYKCAHCPDTFFKLYRSFTRHAINHTNSHRFKCEICDKTFAQFTGLEQHLTTHSTERNFVCSLCNISFKQRASLFKHNKQRHENMTKPTCIKCNKELMSKETLEQHLKSKHSEIMAKDIECPNCDEKFASKTALNYHKLTHSKASTPIKFPCTVSTCKKIFKSTALRKSHIVQHHKNVDE